ncbi:hypothetical protein D3C72_2466380 [compost metagenome]
MLSRINWSTVSSMTKWVRPPEAMIATRALLSHDRMARASERPNAWQRPAVGWFGE